MPRWLIYLLIGGAVGLAVVGGLYLFGVFDEEATASTPILILSPDTTTTTTVEETTTTTVEETTTTTVAETTTTAPDETTTTAPGETTTTEAPTTTTEPPTTTTTPPETSTTLDPTAPPEDVALIEEFIVLFNDAVAEGDTDWLYDHLNPIVIEIYGEDSCRAFVDTTISNVIDLAIAGPVLGPMTQDLPTEPPATVDDLYVADVSFTYLEQPQETQAQFHITQVTTGIDTPVTYFAKCDQAVVAPA